MRWPEEISGEVEDEEQELHLIRLNLNYTFSSSSPSLYILLNIVVYTRLVSRANVEVLR